MGHPAKPKLFLGVREAYSCGHALDVLARPSYAAILGREASALTQEAEHRNEGCFVYVQWSYRFTFQSSMQPL